MTELEAWNVAARTTAKAKRKLEQPGLIAARVATWPKPGNAKLSKLVRHAARADAPHSPADA